MSSALKPALTPSGAPNPPVPSQMNKPILTQGAPTTYGQPMSHIPQNLVNISHNAPVSANVHNPAHSNAHSINPNVHSTSHSANHYSLNVPNAAQHYPSSGNTPIITHSAPVSNHPVPNTTQSHTQPASTFSPSPKNLSFNPNYQASLGHSYKMPNVAPPAPVLQVSQVQTVENASIADKHQSNGTPDIKIASKPELVQNHVTAVVKEKPIHPPQPSPPEIQVVPSTPEKAKIIPEQPTLQQEEESVKEDHQDPDENKTSDVDNTPTPEVEESSTLTMTATAESVPSSVNSANSSKENSPSDLELPVVSVSAEPMQDTPSPSVEVPENAEPQGESPSPTTVNVSKSKEQSNQKSTLKLATPPRSQTKKSKPTKVEVSETPKISKLEAKSVQKSPSSGGKSKRTRTKTQPYQSPLPEVEMISKITATTPRNKNIEDKLIIFYKNEFLAVRNSEGGFYICQAMQNIYKSSPRIRIRWLSQDKNDKELYTPDFYDNTDFDCILTNLNLSRAGKGKYKLPSAEKIRTDSILKRALAVEKGDAKPTSLTEEHPDGLDLSLYKEESQLKKRIALKRKASTPMKAARSQSSSSTIKSPDQPKVQKVSPKPKPPPVKKATVLKKALSAKLKKSTSARLDRVAKKPVDEPRVTSKTVSVIDQKKAKVLAKVARRAAVSMTKTQPPPKQNVKISKVTTAPSMKKPVIAKKATGATVTRKSKRGKK